VIRHYTLNSPVRVRAISEGNLDGSGGRIVEADFETETLEILTDCHFEGLGLISYGTSYHAANKRTA